MPVKSRTELCTVSIDALFVDDLVKASPGCIEGPENCDHLRSGNKIKKYNTFLLNRIVSQDLGMLQMVLLERYRALDITACCSFF
jgi:hypothetical protein